MTMKVLLLITLSSVLETGDKDDNDGGIVTGDCGVGTGIDAGVCCFCLSVLAGNGAFPIFICVYTKPQVHTKKPMAMLQIHKFHVAKPKFGFIPKRLGVNLGIHKLHKLGLNLEHIIHSPFLSIIKLCLPPSCCPRILTFQQHHGQGRKL